MDILKALKKEEAKLEKFAKNALKQAAALKETMKFFGGSVSSGLSIAKKKRRKMSAAGRANIVKATKARWAKVREAKAAKPRRKMSAAGKRAIAKAQKARWAKVRAAAKPHVVKAV
jgi:hypothetical protein